MQEKSQEKTQEKIALLVGAVEQQTDAQIIVIFADRASHYRIIPLLYATLIALPLAFLLYEFTNMAIPQILTLQLVSFLGLWLITSYAPVKRFITPRLHKTARITQRTRDLLWSYKNLNTNPRPLLLLFIADDERMVGLKSTCLGDEILENTLPAFTASYKNNPEKALEGILSNLTPHLVAIAPKTTMENSVKDVPFNL